MTEPAHPYRAPASRPPRRDELSIPYDGQARVRLTLEHGISTARVRIDPSARELVTIDPGSATAPRIEASAHEVRVRCATSLGDWLRGMIEGERAMEIVLHPAVAWELSVRGGVSQLRADLRSGELSAIEIGGGCSDLELELPIPAHTVPIRIGGGASRVRVRRPANVGVRVEVLGGIASMRLDAKRFDAVGGSARLETGDPTGPRYELEISGGVSDVEVA